MFIDLREKGRKGEGKGKREREIGCFPYAPPSPHWESNPQLFGAQDGALTNRAALPGLLDYS